MPRTDDAPASEPAATMPPLDLLLALDTHALMGVVDAKLAGGTWIHEEPRWRLYPLPRTRLTHIATILGNGVFNDLGTPNPLEDDGDAYRMETRERVVVVDSEDGQYGIAVADVIHDPVNAGFCLALWGEQHLAADRKHAACLAVCHKYADHHDLGQLCRELITRLASNENRQPTS